jgi:tripartite-type tricarboxylate transporter receptor subunit TctC
MSTTRRRFLGHSTAAFGATLFSRGVVRAQSPGDRPTDAPIDPPIETLRIVIGFAAGGSGDLLARSVAEALRGTHARTTLVDNRIGAGGQLALLSLKTAPADGSTLLLTPSSMLTLFPHTYKQLQYDPLRDVAPVSLACTFDLAFAIGPQVDASVRTLAEFIAWARAHPDLANFGSPATGSSTHFVGEMLARAGNVPLRHVPYRGSRPAIVDLMGGQIAAVCTPLGDMLPHLQAGPIRLLGVCGTRRSRFVPEVPTFVEQGLKDIVADGWYAFYLPGGAGPQVVQRANAALRTALDDAQVVAMLSRMGFDPAGSSPAELAALQRRDSERWGAVVKALGFTAV